MRLAIVLAAASLLLVACAAEPVVKKAKGPLAMAQDNPLRVEKMSEEYDYIKAQRCGTTGHWRMGDQSMLPTPQLPENTGCMLDKFPVTCSQGSEVAAFYFMQCP